ncbi:MAG: hypothetical protein JXA74_02025 [Anaerolineae bacterium]|nr:hypothetical protein [Anaerolineae bacterium]
MQVPKNHKPAGERRKWKYVYLAFEKVYRFTPFSQDAQLRIRGQSPLQLAGYPVHELPMAVLCAGWALAPPTSLSLESVPNA